MVEVPKGYESDHPTKFDGGTKEDHEALLTLLYAFRVANDRLDIDALRKLWTSSDEAVYFNTNGHAYYGIDDWAHIWDHYRPRLKLEKAGGCGTIRIMVRGEMALITDDRQGRHWIWMGKESSPGFLDDQPYV